MMSESSANKHLPVLEKEVIQAFMEQVRTPIRFLDGTLGRGGHMQSILKTFPSSKIVCFDKDQQAIQFAQETFNSWITAGRLQLINDDFKNLSKHGLGLFDGALFDLGVSSPQLDQAERGFSFMHDGPLDMRMSTEDEVTAEEIVNTYEEKELSDIFYHWGEIRMPNRVVRAIVHDRKANPFKTTKQLASLIERVEGWKKKGSHPATHFFMALRIAVNGELEGLEKFIEDMPTFLEPGARLLFISFHSLEDRIVKTVFRRMNKNVGTIINKKVIISGDEELEINPRSRSAKLRIFERGGVK